MHDQAMTLETVSHNFGGFHVLRDINLTIARGGRTALIGPNGAGKTTLFNILDGTLLPAQGRVYVEGEEITRLGAHKRARLGIARTYQVTNLLTRLSVRENVGLALAGMSRGKRADFWRPLHLNSEVRATTAEMLEQWDLDKLAEQPVSSLAYGQQRILEIVLGLVRKPKILLLDEPTAGLAKRDADIVADVVSQLPRDVTIVMIEHDMDVAFKFADEMCVLHQGGILAQGPPDVVRTDPKVIAAYFGETADA